MLKYIAKFWAIKRPVFQEIFARAVVQTQHFLSNHVTVVQFILLIAKIIG